MTIILTKCKDNCHVTRIYVTKCKDNCHVTGFFVTKCKDNCHATTQSGEIMTGDDLHTALIDQLAEAGEQGLGMEQLRELNPTFSDRQLRYRLDALRLAGSIERTGQGRSTRYVSCVEPSIKNMSPDVPETSQPEPILKATPSHPVFGDASLETMARLDLPVASRVIAHYDQSWLTELGTCSALTSDDRRRLHVLGATGLEDDIAGTYIRQINERLLIDLSWASSALEGNTYSLLDTRELIAHGVAAEGKDRVETTMILNHKRALEFLMDAVDYGITRLVASNLHATLMEDLLHDARSLGAVRDRPVRISMSTYIPPDVPSMLREELERIFAFARAYDDPFDASFLLLIALPYLQAFLDGNKRTARLIANLPLFRHNVRPLSFVDIEREDYLRAMLCVYEFRDPGPMRELFMHAYERSCARYPEVRAIVPDPDPFRLMHRDKIYDVVREVVSMPDVRIESEVEAHAKDLFEDREERAKFIAIVLGDLDALHEGNFMRYRITPRQFEAWDARRSL